eukprot:scaffold25593_cov123-Isochrysis_galbana.AAC.2
MSMSSPVSALLILILMSRYSIVGAGWFGSARGLFESCAQGASNVVLVIGWVSRGRGFDGFEEGWFGRPSERNGCRRFARLAGLSLFCFLLVPGAKECPQAP